MNLSKIAVGVAASLCLVSNITFAESTPPSPVIDSPTSISESVNKYSKSLQDKAGERFLAHMEELGLTPEDIKNLNPKEFEGERLEKLKDSLGYLGALVYLDNVKADFNRFQRYYPFKLLNDEINDNKKQLDEHLEGIKIANHTISKVASEKANVKDVQTNILGIAENKKAIATNKSSIEANKTKIDANKSSIEKNVKSISEINDKIALNHKSIQDVKSQLNARLNNLNKDLRRGLATQSALTGLFQPYSVGKMNVTAAVGGYQSEKAIAVGSGYRFNDNFAAKVGLSKSLGGSAVSYNMGVNYEF